MATSSIHPLSVLVVDDDPVLCELLEMLLGSEGYSVSAFETVDSAVAALRGEAKPDVVLTDLNLPEAKPGELVDTLRAHCPEGTALLGMSASAPNADVRALLDGFLMKPFGVEEFEAALAQVSRKGGGAPKPEPANATSTTAVLDKDVYQRLAASIPVAQLRELYSFSLTDAKGRIERIRAAAESGDTETCRQEAHALKGGCGMVGAAELRGLAASIEAGAPADTSALAEMAAACVRLRRMLDTLP